MEPLETLIGGYRQMVRIRLTEERIAQEYPKDEMKCPTHLSIGQEAAAVGMCTNLDADDIIYSTHRCHAHYLAKGGNLKQMIAEMYGKASGCAHGRGGSMHLVDVAAGMYGTSAIVCGSMPLPVGAALTFKLKNQPRVAVAFFGDAGVEPGVFHECMNFSVLYRLPVIFFCENNDYSTMTRRFERQSVPIAPRAASYGMPGVTVDGNDFLAVFRTAREAVERARFGDGPTLIEAVTYRWREHVEHNAGIMARPKDELAYWQARCPVARFRRELLSYEVAEETLAGIERETKEEVENAFRFARESPAPDPADLLSDVGDEIAISRFEPSEETRVQTCAEAIADATVQAMENDPNVFVLGLHVTDANGVFGTTVPAFRRFGRARVLETPIMEASLTGIAGGAAIMGMRPIFVNARNDFLLLTMSQLGNELSKWSYMTAGRLKVPLVIRAIVGRSRGQGPQHSQSLQSLFAYFPGLHVVAPSNAYDAKGLLLSALAGNTPVIFLEHRLIHPLSMPVPVAPYRIPIGHAKIVRPGTDVTIVALLQMVYEAEKAAEALAKEGVSVEVIDLRSIRPWDLDTVLASVRKTGRLIVADTGWVDFGISAEIVATVVEGDGLRLLKASPVRIGLPPCPTPTAEILETAYYPGAPQIVAAALRLFGKEANGVDRASVLPAISGPF